MRILASTTAGIGHFMPMVGVLDACRHAGHEVLVACPASFAATVEDQGSRWPRSPTCRRRSGMR